MTSQTAIAIAAIISAVAAVAAVLASLLNRAKLQELHLTLNSRLTEMLRIIAATNQAIGRADEKRDIAAAVHQTTQVPPAA